ncbi:SH3 domain-containing protein [Dokdonella sp.]|uniref:C40 family peptidase n=1 Tax=Dokdonella sp. TaxID=2291710 RepID=UPI001B005EAA|nr:SH3 domain-containing protein [Dokdonella sp.]MBO9663768.1 SH3 domain-containing protein [Dokdonella sp.]
MSSTLSNIALTVALALAGTPLQARETPPVPAHGVVGVEEAQLVPDYWIARLPHADRVLLDRAAIAAQNAALFRSDPSMHDLRALPSMLARADVARWIEELAEMPPEGYYGEDGQRVPQARLDAILAGRALEAIAPQRAARYGLVVRRAALRAFPTDLRVFDEPGDRDIDRFQESALFPGMPVVVAHESRDGRWWFVISERYAAWIEKSAVALGERDPVLGYDEAKPYRVVTGATARTVYSPEQPALSQLQLDMGLRLPLAVGWPENRPVNGQHPYTAHVIELPLRREDGSLALAPALLPKTADTRADYLPLSEANLLRQAFKFLGERYGWGHSYDARDCSGFVSDVYHSFGLELPRNTRDQGVSPALRKRVFTAGDDHAARQAAARALRVGDLIYIPGHVMMAIGHRDGEPYVIHDTTGLSYRDGDGRTTRVRLNAVSVSPLLPLLFGGRGDTYVDRMTSIVRIAPDSHDPAKDSP